MRGLGAYILNLPCHSHHLLQLDATACCNLRSWLWFISAMTRLQGCVLLLHLLAQVLMLQHQMAG